MSNFYRHNLTPPYHWINYLNLITQYGIEVLHWWASPNKHQNAELLSWRNKAWKQKQLSCWRKMIALHHKNRSWMLSHRMKSFPQCSSQMLSITWSHSLRFTGENRHMATVAWFTRISSTSWGNAWQEDPSFVRLERSEAQFQFITALFDQITEYTWWGFHRFSWK